MQHWMQVTPQQKPWATHTSPIWSQSFRELTVFVSLSLLLIFVSLQLYLTPSLRAKLLTAKALCTTFGVATLLHSAAYRNVALFH